MEAETTFTSTKNIFQTVHAHNSWYSTVAKIPLLTAVVHVCCLIHILTIYALKSVLYIKLPISGYATKIQEKLH